MDIRGWQYAKCFPNNYCIWLLNFTCATSINQAEPLAKLCLFPAASGSVMAVIWASAQSLTSMTLKFNLGNMGIWCSSNLSRIYNVTNEVLVCFLSIFMYTILFSSPVSNLTAQWEITFVLRVLSLFIQISLH